MFLLRSLLQSELLVKIYFDVSTGCLHFEIYQEDTRCVSVVREKKKKKILNGFHKVVVEVILPFMVINSSHFFYCTYMRQITPVTNAGPSYPMGLVGLGPGPPTSRGPPSSRSGNFFL